MCPFVIKLKGLKYQCEFNTDLFLYWSPCSLHSQQQHSYFWKQFRSKQGCVQEQRRSLFSIDWVILLYQFTGVVFHSSTFKNIPFTFYSTLWLCNVSFHVILLFIKLMSSPGWARWTTGFTSSGLLKAPCIFEFELFWRTANFER